MKSGWKTTEFYGAWAVKIFGALFASGIFGDGSTAQRIMGAALTILGFLGYTYSRTIIKSAAVLILFCAISSQAACSSPAGRRTAAGVTDFLNCESPHVDAQLLVDSKVLAIAAVGKWISGVGTLDPAGVKADAAPLKSDLLRCAFDAAIAALVTPPPVQSGAPAAAGVTVNVVQVSATWSRVRSELGWPAAR